uniref:Uncharacterized protein n=1 Tax=uncultured Nocardioidaceae bacterium TaxID=253824 RepID=A0A6J4KSS7_9ACTN|nr:MAG: hypothetical protein AVDCRST_MAG46-389 [uncultured Nocardioidaceae bacterium]
MALTSATATTASTAQWSSRNHVTASTSSARTGTATGHVTRPCASMPSNLASAVGASSPEVRRGQESRSVAVWADLALSHAQRTEPTSAERKSEMPTKNARKESEGFTAEERLR